MEISAAHGTTTGAAQGTEVFQFILHFKWEGFLKVMFFFCVVSLFFRSSAFLFSRFARLLTECTMINEFPMMA